MPACDGQILGIWGILNFRRLIQQIKHIPHINQALADFAVYCSKEIQRHGNLDHIGIDDDEIPNTHCASLYRIGRHDQHGNQTQCDDQRLAKIQEGQGITGFQRRFFIAAHRAVISIRLALFGAEILHRFKV